MSPQWIADRRRRHEWEADEYEDGGLTFDAIDLVLLLVLAALVYKGVQMVGGSALWLPAGRGPKCMPPCVGTCAAGVRIHGP
jgi:hypothetical protein